MDTPMDSATMTETVAYIDEKIASNACLQHVGVNVAKIVNIQKNPTLKASVEACDLINIDGMGLVWGANLLGHQVPERVAGVDLFHELLKLSQEKNYSVFFLGAKQEVLEVMLNNVKKQYPKLLIAGAHHGYFWEDERAMVSQIKAAKAQLLFVAMSSPKKENFIHQWKFELGVNLIMGVGGTFDVVAGKVRRAPRWVQNLGMEWLFRVAQEPRRLAKRYFVTNLSFFWMVITRKLIQRNSENSVK